MSFPVQNFGVRRTCVTPPNCGLIGIVVFTAFALRSGCSNMSSITSTPFGPTTLACMLYKSTFGPLSIQRLMPSGPMHACGVPLILMSCIDAASHPDLTSAVPCTNSAFSAM